MLTKVAIKNVAAQDVGRLCRYPLVHHVAVALAVGGLVEELAHWVVMPDAAFVCAALSKPSTVEIALELEPTERVAQSLAAGLEVKSLVYPVSASTFAAQPEKVEINNDNINVPIGK